MIRILIADDHPILRHGLKLIITEEYPTAEIAEAGNGEELIAKAMDGEWDIILCDLSMPGCGGLEALRAIKKNLPQLPVLIMSMHPADQYAIDVLKAGASGYIEKNSIDSMLIKAMQVISLGKKFITPAIVDELAGKFIEDGSPQPHENLSERELEVFKLLASGKTVSEIAKELSLGVTTISTYRAHIKAKMRMQNNADIVRYAVENKMV